MDRSNLKPNVDAVAGSEYFYDSPEELERKVNVLKQLTAQNEANLTILK